MQKGWVSVCIQRLMIPFSTSWALAAPLPTHDSALTDVTLMPSTECCWQPESLENTKYEQTNPKPLQTNRETPLPPKAPKVFLDFGQSWLIQEPLLQQLWDSPTSSHLGLSFPFVSTLSHVGSLRVTLLRTMKYDFSLNRNTPELWRIIFSKKHFVMVL